MPAKNNRKTLKRNKGSRNLTRKQNMNAFNFISRRMSNGMSANGVRNAARNLNQNMRNRINRELNSMGL
jgi:hypothetical protein